jgi:DNA-3-methyladenine glycosylase II
MSEHMTLKSSDQYERIIKSELCIQEATAWLSAHEPRFSQALQKTGPLPLRLRPDGFERLLSAIVSQQISVAAADAIWNRMKAAGFTNPKIILSASEEKLRSAGLSRQKCRYAKALSEADIDYQGLRTLSSEDIIKTLTRVSGIGVWTAEIYVMFSLGRADVFASGDLALQESARVLFALPERPKEKELRVMSQDWSPWRAVAARLLWAYYSNVKSREGIR